MKSNSKKSGTDGNSITEPLLTDVHRFPPPTPQRTGLRLLLERRVTKE